VTTADAKTGTWLTQEAYDRLSAELNELIENRPRMAKEINDRREEGDLKENGGYHAAREEQGKQEARIRQLTVMLRDAHVGEAPKTDKVGPGMVVTIAFDGDEDDTETFLLGSRETASTTDLSVFSPESPLGSAVVGRKIGETASYTTPNGKELSVKVLAAEPFTG
jgi:transcription elongation factor GreA